MATMFPAFQHKPFESAGFNHFTLPFRFVSTDGTGCQEEAYAFSFLMSSSLDWARGCYCARHVYFVFKRNSAIMQKLAHEYDPAVIADRLRDWQASHAVGGELRCSKQGFTGTLEIFDRTGQKVFTKEYKTPQKFFALLGDMAVDGITFFGTRPNNALVKHLHRPRCEHDQSIIDLGKAAFAPERSQTEFGLYKAILERDPNFADVRYWWSNQRLWKDSDRTKYNLQMILTMESYPVIAAFGELTPDDCANEAVASHYSAWVKQISELAGRDVSQDTQIQLRQALNGHPITGEMLERATQEAGEYANDYWLLYRLGRVYSDAECKFNDLDMAASIYLVAIQNFFLTGTGGKGDAFYRLGAVLHALGRNDLAAAVLIRVRSHSESDWKRLEPGTEAALGVVLMKMGKYQEAIGHLRTAFHTSDESWRNECLVEGAVAAALAGHNDVLEQILRDRRSEVESLKMTALLEAYRDLLAGRQVDLSAMEKQWGDTSNSWRSELFLEFIAQVDIMSGNYRRERMLANWFRVQPDNRPLWILYDAYLRYKANKDAAAFYLSLEWLHGDDPWVHQAVADFKERTPQIVTPGADELLEKLKNYPPVRWPAQTQDLKVWKAARKVIDAIPVGAVACAVHELLDKGQYDKAHELALRYHSLCTQSNFCTLQSYTNHLIHLVEQAQAGLPVH
ncbi:MAG: hypothetical protein ABSH10_04020 [Phycisphaerae bacterium]|jgi:tetratricopeptide (TPR) repeat protein